jgi:thioredoxin reductase (NADPH)
MQPIILAVDDDLLVLRAIERDLRAGFGDRYRIVTASSGAEALQTVADLKARNDQIALLVADQRMPAMTGTQFLAAAMDLEPGAKKVLLTAYADTAVAIQAINSINLDHYLMKPWDRPEEGLIPTLEGLLADWQTTADVPYDGLRVARTLWSSPSHEVKEFLARNRVPYRWLDIEKDSAARALVEQIGEDAPLPVVFFPDGDAVAAPPLRLLAEKVGLQTQAEDTTYDLVIVGGGPAGLAAAVNGSAEGLRTLLVEKAATGGQAGTSSRIENYLGFPSGISGGELAERATMQAKRLGTEILLTREVSAIRVADIYRFVQLDDGTEIAAKTVVIATGVSIRELRVPGVADLAGAGVYYGAALTEARNYADRPVVIVGGANSAGQAAMLFARYASVVHLIARAATLEQGMSQYLVDQIRQTDGIDVRLRTEVVEAHGTGRLEAVSLLDKDTNTTVLLPAAAMAIFIGARPRTEFVEGVVERSGAGSILTGLDLVRNGKRPHGWPLKRDPLPLETSVPGIFAAGDVRYGSQARVGAAVGSGGMAVGLIREYLKTI